MILYRKGGSYLAPRYNVLIQPGIQFPGCSDFFEKGKPRLFDVTFKYGRAEVPDNLGRYLIDQGLAQETQLILPPR